MGTSSTISSLRIQSQPVIAASAIAAAMLVPDDIRFVLFRMDVFLVGDFTLRLIGRSEVAVESDVLGVPPVAITIFIKHRLRYFSEYTNEVAPQEGWTARIVLCNDEEHIDSTITPILVAAMSILF
jgi:hypothetical protein